MDQKFPIFCYTFDRSCPEPDTSISLDDLISSPPEITQLLDQLGEQLLEELKQLGTKPFPKIRRFKKRPSIECRILTFK